jgi:hypothetical protein
MLSCLVISSRTVYKLTPLGPLHRKTTACTGEYARIYLKFTIFGKFHAPRARGARAHMPRAKADCQGISPVFLSGISSCKTFGFTKFWLANFESTCKGTDRCSLGPPVAGVGDGVLGNAEGSMRAELAFFPLDS